MFSPICGKLRKLIGAENRDYESLGRMEGGEERVGVWIKAANVDLDRSNVGSQAGHDDRVV